MNVGNTLNLELGKYQKQVESKLQKLKEQNFVQRLWNKEESLFRNQNELSDVSIGWLNVVDKMLEAAPMINNFSRSISEAKFDRVVLLGMGGSSLAPFVLQKTFEKKAKGLPLIVLDSTDPDTIKKTENEINLATTLFIVASKSGSTAEVMALFNYFYNKVYQLKREKAGTQFIAITDESSSLVELAERKKFRKIFINFSDIGGRFSALSYFGIVPAALVGIDIKALLETARTMVDECGPHIAITENQGVVLGTAIAELAMMGHNKLTYLMPAEFSTFGLWLEQLIAESTGKQGKGILPVNGDPMVEMTDYGKDRVFLQMVIAGQQNNTQSMKLENLISLNYPVINIAVENEMDLGKEFFRWEIATATAGAILGINPFDQPNVEESKKITNQLLKKAEEQGRFPEAEITLSESGLNYYSATRADKGNILIENLFLTSKPGDYITIHAYLPETPEVCEYFAGLQLFLQRRLHLSVSTQFGPRYLHSTGQYHKGGAGNGFFIQFINSSENDLQIPEKSYTFGLLKRAQAFGDMQALKKQDQKVIMVDLGKEMLQGLYSFSKTIESALMTEYELQEQYISKTTLTDNGIKVSFPLSDNSGEANQLNQRI